MKKRRYIMFTTEAAWMRARINVQAGDLARALSDMQIALDASERTLKMILANSPEARNVLALTHPL